MVGNLITKTNMQKEKSVKQYTRRTKSGKTVTVRAYKAKYDAAEELKKAMAKKAGAGEELKAKKLVPTTKEPDYGFTADEFKEWYHWDTESDAKNKAALKVEKALKASMGARGYKKFYDEMTDGYSARGHNKAFKGLGDRMESSKVEAPRNSTRGTDKAAPFGGLESITKEVGSYRGTKATVYGDARVKRDKLFGVWTITDTVTGKEKTTKTPEGAAKEILRIASLPGERMMQHTKLMPNSFKISKAISWGGESMRPSLMFDRNTGRIYGQDPVRVAQYGKEHGGGIKDLTKAQVFKSAKVRSVIKEQIRKTFGDDAAEKYEAVTAPTGKTLKTKKEVKPAQGHSKGAPKKKNYSPKQVTSADLRRQADEMDAKAYKETAKASHKKLIEKGYKKYTYQGRAFYHKGKEGSFGGSYVELDSKGNPKAAVASFKEPLKAVIARKVGKKYTPKALK